uniref:Uncharacterized protein n=1 Tax=Rhizophora mucronata TaxID=61149 RepID=A0A2P2MX95_RHIMU
MMKFFFLNALSVNLVVAVVGNTLHILVLKFVIIYFLCKIMKLILVQSLTNMLLNMVLTIIFLLCVVCCAIYVWFVGS